MLSPKQRKHLKALAHHLEPTVRVGRNEVSPEVVAEAGRSLEAHELIKVKIDASGETREKLAASLATEAGAELVATIGKVAILYRRRADKPRIKLP